MANKQVVSTEVVRCREWSCDAQEHQAVVIVYDDETFEVHCDGGCYQCEYRSTKNWGYQSGLCQGKLLGVYEITSSGECPPVLAA